MITSPLNLDNRRDSGRFYFSRAVESRLESGESLSAQTLNLSLTGARLLVDAKTANQEKFELRFSQNLSVSAQPVWKEAVSGGRSYVIGVKFGPLTQSDSSQLFALSMR